MIDLRLDTQSHDLVISASDLSLVDGVDQIVQQIKQRLWLFRGEWFLDTTAGVPWLDDVLAKNPRRYLVQQAIKDAVLGTPGVDELLSFAIEGPDAQRRANVTFRVRTTAGESDVEVTI